MKSSIPKTHFKPLQAQRHDIFSIPFWTMRWNGDLQQVAQDCRTAVRDIEHAKTHRVHAEENYGQTVETEYTTYFDHDAREETHKQSWYNTFANQMKDTYVEFCRTQYNLNFEDVTRQDIHFFAWVNVYNEPHSHEVHNHVKSRLSGTYYVSTDDASEPIKFWNPNMPALHSQ